MGLVSVYINQLPIDTYRRSLACILAVSDILPKWAKKSTFSDVQRSKIVTLHDEGYSERDIAVEMDYSKSAVHTAISSFEKKIRDSFGQEENRAPKENFH